MAIEVRRLNEAVVEHGQHERAYQIRALGVCGAVLSLALEKTITSEQAELSSAQLDSAFAWRKQSRISELT